MGKKLLVALTLVATLLGPTAAHGGSAMCHGKTATIVGTNADDDLFGTPGRDVIQAKGGFDAVHGLRGNDLICGGGEPDALWGGRGNDALHGGQDSPEAEDNLYGGPGTDICSNGIRLSGCEN